jgi:tRNA-splicing ligase RtcB
MGKLKLTGKQLRSIGYPEGPVISIAMDVMEKNYKRNSVDHALGILKNVLEEPVAYEKDEVLGKIASELIARQKKKEANIDLKSEGVHYNIFGAEFIEEGALSQMTQATKLPVSVAGALMPDAHHGYGLPIGGVLATQNAIIPYGVGVDIGCRMCLSIFNIDPKELEFRESYFIRELNEATLFGAGREFKKRTDHEVLYRKEFSEIDILRGLRDKAAGQLGSSGSGNHFVEFGVVDIPVKDSEFGVEPGKYLGLLSHSGSRAIGATVANHFTKLAKEKRRLPNEASNLAWFNLDEHEGIEYWMAMNLAGDYASACHHVIHDKIAKQLAREPIKMVENHHNFAWKETYEGTDVIVHRKGATPAGKGVLGIIPGSMTAPGFIVKGKGVEASLNSASHGAGRQMSRTAALNNITVKMLKEELEKQGVKLIGGGLDEAPFAYKDIHAVMNAQKNLVDTLGTFSPKIVKMDDTPPRNRRKGKEVAGE